MDLEKDGLNKPMICKECGGHMKFQGLGEYRCEECGTLAYDDYGKVRNYLEEHRGATAYEISQEIGIPQRNIRKLIREERIEVSENSRVFVKCKMCGQDIRLGDLCDSCKKKKTDLEIKSKNTKRSATMSGYGKTKGEVGSKRFRRER